VRGRHIHEKLLESAQHTTERWTARPGPASRRAPAPSGCGRRPGGCPAARLPPERRGGPSRRRPRGRRPSRGTRRPAASADRRGRLRTDPPVLRITCRIVLHGGCGQSLAQQFSVGQHPYEFFVRSRTWMSTQSFWLATCSLGTSRKDASRVCAAKRLRMYGKRRSRWGMGRGRAVLLCTAGKGTQRDHLPGGSAVTCDPHLQHRDGGGVAESCA